MSSACITYAIDRGYSVELARTIALNTLVVMEIFHLFFIRNIYGTSLTWKAVRGTKVVWAVVIVITVAQFAITYLPLAADGIRHRSHSVLGWRADCRCRRGAVCHHRNRKTDSPSGITTK